MFTKKRLLSNQLYDGTIIEAVEVQRTGNAQNGQTGRELRAKGIDIIDLSLGEPDFDTPDHIKQAAEKAVDDNYSHYTPVAGYLDLREAICTKLRRDNDLDYNRKI